MVKILSQAGNSLADMYDVQGSIAGIDQLETRELPISHEMGATLFSERFSTSIRRAVSGALNQNTDFDVVLGTLPGGPSRLLGITVFTDNAARILQAAVLGRDPIAEQEIPLWVWDAANNLDVRMQDDTAALANLAVLIANTGITTPPSFTGGSSQPARVDQIALRGRTTGFGAGTVFIRGLYHIASTTVDSLSSRGLPIPSW